MRRCAQKLWHFTIWGLLLLAVWLSLSRSYPGWWLYQSGLTVHFDWWIPVGQPLLKRLMSQEILPLVSLRCVSPVSMQVFQIPRRDRIWILVELVLNIGSERSIGQLLSDILVVADLVWNSVPVNWKFHSGFCQSLRLPKHLSWAKEVSFLFRSETYGSRHLVDLRYDQVVWHTLVAWGDIIQLGWSRLHLTGQMSVIRLFLKAKFQWVISGQTFRANVRITEFRHSCGTSKNVVIDASLHLGNSKGFQILGVALFFRESVWLEGCRLWCLFILALILHSHHLLFTLKRHWLIFMLTHLDIPVAFYWLLLQVSLHHGWLNSSFFVPHLRGGHHFCLSTCNHNWLPNCSHFVAEIPCRSRFEPNFHGIPISLCVLTIFDSTCLVWGESGLVILVV